MEPEKVEQELADIKKWIVERGNTTYKRVEASQRQGLSVGDGFRFGFGFGLGTMIFVIIGAIFWVVFLAALIKG
jgi:hypothetical protein